MQAVMYADVLIWVLPHQFVGRTVQNMGKIKETCVSVSPRPRSLRKKILSLIYDIISMLYTVQDT